MNTQEIFDELSIEDKVIAMNFYLIFELEKGQFYSREEIVELIADKEIETQQEVKGDYFRVQYGQGGTLALQSFSKYEVLKFIQSLGKPFETWLKRRNYIV